MCCGQSANDPAREVFGLRSDLRVLRDRCWHHNCTQSRVYGIDQDRLLVLDELSREGNDDPVEIETEDMRNIGKSISSAYCTSARQIEVAHVRETSQASINDFMS